MRRPVFLSVVLVGLAVGGLALWFAGRQSVSTAAPAALFETPVTVEAVDGQLIRTFFGAGSIRERDLVTIFGAGGTLTHLPDGDTVVNEGSALVEVDLRPTFVFRGERPMFRDLMRRSEGLDVAQVQEALSRLGYDPGRADGVFGEQTQSAWNSFQKDHGLKGTDAITVRDVAFSPELPARVRLADIQIGAQSSGPLLVLVSVERYAVAEVPIKERASVLENSTVEVIFSDSSRKEATITGVHDSGEVTLDFGPMTTGEDDFRVRFEIGMSGSNGTIVPISALSTDTTGNSYLQVWDPVTATTRSEHVVVVRSNRTDAHVKGNVSPGESLVVG